MAASKKKGMWMNGTGPLGYVNENRTLKIDERNAEKIRLIFDKFLELKNINQLKTYLEEKHIKTKSSKNFYKGHLYRILSNKTYIGKITHTFKNIYKHFRVKHFFNIITTLTWILSFYKHKSD